MARRPREPGAGSARGALAELLQRCLDEGSTVEIERLGFFRPNSEGGFDFTPNQKPGIFIAYVEEDRAAAERLYNAFARAGLDPWMDKKKLLPGQNWPRAIERAISVSDFFIACLSRRSLVKRGAFQSEMRWALDCAHQTPLGDIFFIPVRLEECAVPPQILHSTHCLDLFPDWKAGVEKLISAIRAEYKRRGDRQ